MHHGTEALELVVLVFPLVIVIIDIEVNDMPVRFVRLRRLATGNDRFSRRFTGGGHFAEECRKTSETQTDFCGQFAMARGVV